MPAIGTVAAGGRPAPAGGVRLRQMAKRRAVQAAFGAVAVVFVICALAVAHFAAWLALVKVVPDPLYAALIVFAIDVVIAGILAEALLGGGTGKDQ